jgi:hypothetical protein
MLFPEIKQSIAGRLEEWFVAVIHIADIRFLINLEAIALPVENRIAARISCGFTGNFEKVFVRNVVGCHIGKSIVAPGVKRKWRGIGRLSISQRAVPDQACKGRRAVTAFASIRVLLDLSVLVKNCDVCSLDAMIRHHRLLKLMRAGIVELSCALLCGNDRDAEQDVLNS